MEERAEEQEDFYELIDSSIDMYDTFINVLKGKNFFLKMKAIRMIEEFQRQCKERGPKYQMEEKFSSDQIKDAINESKNEETIKLKEKLLELDQKMNEATATMDKHFSLPKRKNNLKGIRGKKSN